MAFPWQKIVRGLRGYWPIYWPFIVALLVTPLYIDGYIVFEQVVGLPRQYLNKLFIICAVIGTAKLLYSYWMLVRLDEHRQSRHFVLLISRHCRTKANDRWYTRLWKFLARASIKSLQPTTKRPHLPARFGFYFCVLFVGFLPKPGVRTIGLVMCKNRKSMVGLFLLSIGNIIRFALLVYTPHLLHTILKL